ncbi:MAG: DUF5721 family protein [Eubacteriales bacterium]|nr:DUF5721 family protein [Eubacteriales bacterium]
MQTIQILDIKPFMQLLFQTNQLDTYEFVSANLKTDMSYTLDGHLNLDFFEEEERLMLHEEHSPFIFWKFAKEKIFQLIKGKKTPSLLKIVLKLSPAATEQLLQDTRSSLTKHDIDGMFINILFQDHALSVICGISYKIFTMEKHLEQEFTTTIVSLFRQNHITIQQ